VQRGNLGSAARIRLQAALQASGWPWPAKTPTLAKRSLSSSPALPHKRPILIYPRVPTGWRWNAVIDRT